MSIIREILLYLHRKLQAFYINLYQLYYKKFAKLYWIVYFEFAACLAACFITDIYNLEFGYDGL